MDVALLWLSGFLIGLGLGPAVYARYRLAGFVEFGSIHTARCLDSYRIDPEVGARPGDAALGCVCDGIPTFIRRADLFCAPLDKDPG